MPAQISAKPPPAGGQPFVRDDQRHDQDDAGHSERATVIFHSKGASAGTSLRAVVTSNGPSTIRNASARSATAPTST